MRRVYVYDPETKQMVPKEQARPRGVVQAPLIMGDMPDFVSPIDQSVINGRRDYREHAKRYGVTNIADYTETWKKAAERRADFYANGPRQGVKEALIRAINTRR